MTESKYLCRLCKGTEFLYNLYKVEGDTSLVDKTNQCIGLKIRRNDGLPSMICKFCKRMIKRFYVFKQNCLKVNFELNINKGLKSKSKTENSIQINTEFPLTVKRENDLLELYSAEENIKNDVSKLIIKIKNSIKTNSEELKDQVENDSSGENIRFDISDVEHVFDFTIENPLNMNKDEHSQSSIQCELCGSIYQTKTEYTTHLSSHCEARLYQCKFCNKHFTRAESREIHMRTHLGIRPFICEICGRSTTKKQDLIRHMKIHSDERNFECLTCGRKFKRSMDLHTHRRTHTGARPYKCQNCGKGYTSHSGLRKHVKSNVCKELDMKRQMLK